MVDLPKWKIPKKSGQPNLWRLSVSDAEGLLTTLELRAPWLTVPQKSELAKEIARANAWAEASATVMRSQGGHAEAIRRTSALLEELKQIKVYMLVEHAQLSKSHACRLWFVKVAKVLTFLLVCATFVLCINDSNRFLRW
jgi:hypothetical protein